MLLYLIGLITGGALMYLISAVRAGKVTVAWYQWVLGVIAYLFLVLGIQNIIGFRAGYENAAAGFVFRFYGLMFVIFACGCEDLQPCRFRVVMAFAQRCPVRGLTSVIRLTGAHQ